VCCVCSHNYPSRNAHAPSYNHLWRPTLPHFSTISHKRYDNRKNCTENKVRVLISSTTFVSSICHSKKKCTLVFLSKVPVIIVRHEFSRQVFEKYSNTKFHENPSSGSRVVPCGRTDTTKLIAALRNFANAPKKTYVVQDCLIY